MVLRVMSHNIHQAHEHAFDDLTDKENPDCELIDEAVQLMLILT